MDEDRLKGVGMPGAGWIKEAVGEVTGDTKTDAEGIVHKTSGKVQNVVGIARDMVRDAVNK